MRLYLLRHGVTRWNLEARCQGQRDVPLDDVGREQAHAVRQRIESLVLDAVYASDLSRAAETAELALAGARHAPCPDPALREMHFGSWEGLTGEELEARHGPDRRRWKEEPTAVRPPGGETLDELQRRVVARLTELAQRHPDERVLAVSHGFAIVGAVCHALGVPLSAFRRFWLGPTGLTEVEVRPDRHVLRRFNDLGHLEGPS